jgi:hypothetical protein
MGITLKMRREMVQVERDVMKGLREDLRKIRAAMNQSRLNIKMHQEVLVEERKLKRIMMEDQRALRAQKQAERAAARIAKAEARLQMLRDKAVARAAKATRKASPVKVWSPEQVAALNAANGAV